MSTGDLVFASVIGFVIVVSWGAFIWIIVMTVLNFRRDAKHLREHQHHHEEHHQGETDDVVALQPKGVQHHKGQVHRVDRELGVPEEEENPWADLAPESVQHISFDAGTPQGQPKHPRHPFSQQTRERREEDLRKLFGELDDQNEETHG